MIMHIFIILSVIKVLSSTDSYEFSCPPQAHWRLRAKSVCMPEGKYSCLYDVNLQVNVYRDKCIRPRILGPGYKYVFQPNPNRDVCRISRYQPFNFNTTGYSDCALLKSLCNSDGQTTYANGTTISDRTCSCDTEKGYHFVNEPKTGCYCNPSSEDCSCYIGFNQTNTTIGFKDFNCFGVLISNLRENEFHKSKAHMINDFDNYKYNLIGPTSEHRTDAVMCVLIFGLSYTLVAVGIYILQRITISRMIRIESKCIKYLEERMW